MSLAPGTRIGPFKIIAPLGEGGMGEVYRASDRRLDREVAVKILPETLAQDSERMLRFEREARAAGQLQHPNIVAVHDIGTHGPSPYLVTELLEGETLRSRLKAGAIPPAKALRWALEIASGLAAAHERGIVHRDIKPENLFVTYDGRIKILDFGLAKLTAEIPDSVSSSPTLEAKTTPGALIGTVGYMAPEQVRGEPAVPQSDVFAFGAVLLEMLTGVRSFDGGNAIGTLNAILEKEPQGLRGIEQRVGPHAARLLRRCLEKEPRERFASGHDIDVALEAISDPGSRSFDSIAAGNRGKMTGPARSRMLLGVAAALALLVVAVLVWTSSAGRLAPAAVRMPFFRQITFRRGTVYTARFTADGRSVVYSAAWDGRPTELYSVSLETAASRSLGLTLNDVCGVSWGEDVAVIRRQEMGFGPGTLARVPLAGGPPRDILDNVMWADWRSDREDFVVIRLVGGLPRLELPAGRPLKTQLEGFANYPRLSPDGKRIALLEHPLPSEDGGALVVLDERGNRLLVSGGWNSIEGAGWRPDGKEVWFTAAREGIALSLWALSMDGKVRLIVNAPGRLVLHDVSGSGRIVGERNTFRATITGRLSGEPAEHDLSWLDFSELGDVAADGQTLLFSESGEGNGRGVSTFLRKAGAPIPVRLGEGRGLALSPDGKTALAVVIEPAPHLVLLPTGVGNSRSLPAGSIGEFRRAAWLPDGTEIVILGAETGRPRRLWIQNLKGGTPRALSAEGAWMGNRSLSPDGSLIAAQVDGNPVLLPVTGSGAKRPIPGGRPGDYPIGWNAGGTSLWIQETAEFPIRVVRIELDTGRRVLWREIALPDPSGVLSSGTIIVAPEGDWWAWQSYQLLSDLYLIDGVQ